MKIFLNKISPAEGTAIAHTKQRESLASRKLKADISSSRKSALEVVLLCHFKGVRQLLEKPAKQHVESVEESESDDEQLVDTQLIPPSALPRALKFRNEAASAVTPLPNTGQGSKPSFKIDACGSNRMLFEAREQDMVEEDVAEDASASAKKQRWMRRHLHLSRGMSLLMLTTQHQLTEASSPQI